MVSFRPKGFFKRLQAGVVFIFGLSTYSLADSVKIDNIPVSSGIDNTQIFIKHNIVGQEGSDSGDVTSFPPMVNSKALRSWTNPYSTNLLSSDNRPTNSLTYFNADLVAKDNVGDGVTTSNYLYFVISSPLDYGRKDYKIDVDIWGNGSSNSPYFSKTYGLQDLVSNKSSKTDTWGLTNLSNNTKYGRVIMTPLTNIYSSGYSVNIENGTNFGLSPTNFSNIPYGGSITVGVANIYYTNGSGSRQKFAGFEKVH